MAQPGAPQRGTDTTKAGDGDVPESARARPSKTARKNKARDLQALGTVLAGLANERLQSIEMPEPLREAIEQVRCIRSHEARRRQERFVGKLVRAADEAALREALAAAELGSARETLALHEAERWRAELLAGDEGLARWLQAHPTCDAQRLRSLVRAARRDAGDLDREARRPKSFRDLFQFIRPLVILDE
jgi:ribosome-associated protein